MPEGFADTKFKLVLAASGKLNTNKWTQLYRIEICGFYKGTDGKITNNKQLV